MENYTISERLKRVASYVPEGARLVDVGSDHAYLPIYLTKLNRLTAAVAGEVVEGPYQSALNNVAKEGLNDQIQVRLANGLAAVTAADQIDTVVIAGMGGRLIADILGAGLDQVPQVNRLILQPNNREDDLRAYLLAQGFDLVAEEILEEAGKTYEILVAQAGDPKWDEKDLRFGPILRTVQDPVFRKKWSGERDKLSYALSQVPADNDAARERLEKRIAEIEEVLNVSQ